VDDVRLEIPGGTAAPAIVRFTAIPTSVPFGGATTLTWVTQNADLVEIDNGIGPVARSGSRSVSLQDDGTLVLIATGPAGRVQRPVSIEVRSPGPSISFSASPDFIQKGGTSTLRWQTTDATDVSIDNGIGAVATSGSLTVTPSTTTEYTLTASGAGVTSSARAAVFVDPGDVPIVSVTSFPRGIVGLAGVAAGLNDRYALTNLGSVGTTITLGQSGDFFAQSPASFELPAGATQVVTITTTQQAAGKFEGASLPTGLGVPAGLSLGVRLFLAAPPTGTVAPTTAVGRTEIAAPANENPSGSVAFTNNGSGVLQGIVTADAAWLIPQSDVVVIQPGATKEVTFTTNRALRPDAASPGGAAVATLTLSYLDFAGSSLVPSIAQASGTAGTSSISVTVIDVVKASAAPTGPPPLGAGEVAFFVPGLAQIPGSSGDLLLSISGNSISDLKLYLGAQGAPPVLGALDQIAPNSGLSLPSVVQTLFGSNVRSGTVQARSANLSRVSVAGVQTNGGSSPLGTFITALPTFRSDLSAAPNETIYLAGVEKAGERLTNVFVQEVTGLPAAATVEYFNAAGDVVSSRVEDDIAAFALLSLPDSVPAGAASVRITNTSRGAARIVGYAAVVDAATGDLWTIVDSKSVGSSAEQIIGVVPPPSNAAITTNVLYVLNPDASPVEIDVENLITPGRRRAVRTNDVAVTGATTIGPRQTVALPIAFSSGLVRVKAARPIVVTARSMQKLLPQPGSFGTALPVVPAGAALTTGQSRRFASVDDAARATVVSRAGGTYRSNVGLIETAGQPAVVRLTLRYAFGTGIKASAQGISSVEVRIPANRLLMVNDIGRALIGPSRDSLGDLRNMQLDVTVVSGAGVFPFVQSIDNGSADSTIRVQ
jgi:hypothetical protein